MVIAPPPAADPPPQEPATGWYDPPPGDEVDVDAPPPAPQAEQATAPPAPAYVRDPGYWSWRGGRHVWLAGQWGAPHAGSVWVPAHWDQRGRHWHFRPGRRRRPYGSD